MKAKRFFLLVFWVVGLSVNAQPPYPDEGRKENVEAVKIAFITRELNLTPQEAQAFWPVYNQFQNEMEVLKKERKDERREVKKGIEQMADAEVAKMVDDFIIFEQRELDIKKKYHAEFKKVLPIRKIAQLYRAEQEFKREVLRRMREENHPPKPPVPR